ncbi:MAG: DNA-directed RNA polymerase subunit omega [Lutisporaceae bacterium]
MIYPTLRALLEKIDSKYTLVVAVSKRARQIVEGQPKLTKTPSNKPVTVAVNEIAEGRIGYERAVINSEEDTKVVKLTEQVNE